MCHLPPVGFTGLTMSGLDSIGAIYKPIIKHKFFMTLGLVERTCYDLGWMYSFFWLVWNKSIGAHSWDSDDGLVNGKKELCFWNRSVRNCLIHAWSMLPSSEVTLLERLVYFMSVLLLLSIALMNLVSWLQTEPWILEEWVWGCGWCISVFPDAKRGEIAHHWTKEFPCISQRYRWLDLGI